jgi:hypothetical protein
MGLLQFSTRGKRKQSRMFSHSAVRTTLYKFYKDLRSGRLVAMQGLKSLQFIYRQKPIPVRALLFLHSLTDRQKRLAPDRTYLFATERSIVNVALARILQNETLGGWALNHASINFLERQVKSLKPHLILEFGSGTSTVCLVHFMREIYGDSSSAIYVVSIDQNESYKTSTEQLLNRAGFSQHVQVICAPLREQVIEGVRLPCRIRCPLRNPSFVETIPQSRSAFLYG